MNTRFPFFAGALLIVLGAVLLVMSAQVLVTFLLELVTQTISADPDWSPDPQEFSWGTMEWGNMGSDFSLVAVGFVLVALGQCLVLPATIGRIKMAEGGPALFPKVLLIGAAVLAAVAAASLLHVGWASRQAFGMLAASGVADPMMLGENLPVRSARVFMVAMVVSQLLVVVAALLDARQPVSDSPMRVRSILAILSCVCVVLTALGIVTTRFGPVRHFELMLTSSRGVGDPALLAGQISGAIYTLIFAALLLGVSAILNLLAVVIPARRRT